MDTDIAEGNLNQAWPKNHFPPQAGRLAVVTGGTGGLGYEIALALAQDGADVVLAGRSEAKGRNAAGEIRARAPKALVRFERLDLADLASVAAIAGRLGSAGRPIDLLVNNAGVMAVPQPQSTADGFEMQFGTNYLGHFALTGQLLPLLHLSRGPRVIQVSSLAHRFGRIRFDDLHGARKYNPWAAYAQSKLALLLFAHELQRQSDAHGWGLLSIAVHPGYARTLLFSNGPGAGSWLSRMSRFVGPVMGQSAAQGALPAVYASASELVQPGGFYGPGGMLELAGPPAEAFVSRRARDHEVARRLWQVSEQLTGLKWSGE